MIADDTFTPTEGCEQLADQLRRLVVLVEALHGAVGEVPRQATPQGLRTTERVYHLARLADEVAGEALDLLDDVSAKLERHQQRQRAVRP